MNQICYLKIAAQQFQSAINTAIHPKLTKNELKEKTLKTLTLFLIYISVAEPHLSFSKMSTSKWEEKQLFVQTNKQTNQNLYILWYCQKPVEITLAFQFNLISFPCFPYFQQISYSYY